MLLTLPRRVVPAARSTDTVNSRPIYLAGFLCALALTAGCGLFKKREHRAADCLDGVAETSTRWVALARAIEAAKRQRSPAVAAQRTAADAIQCAYTDAACAQRRTAAQAAAQLAEEALDKLNPDAARRVAGRENPLEQLLAGRNYEAPEGFAGPELAAARGAVDTMWESCKLACRDLRCTGR
jgi:hypothetical protein